MNALMRALREMPGFLWGPRLYSHPDAQALPGLRTLSPLQALRKWPIASHPDALGYFARKRLIANPETL